MDLKEKLDSIPDKPGCYIFKKDDEIIYVGKAISLKKRVDSYFHIPLEDSPKLQNLMGEFTDITWEITNSEIEALLLEASLIKQYKPKFNSREKDDKSFPYIHITDEPFPRIFIKRLIKNAERKPGIYYGPFIDVKALRNTLKFVLRTFPIATCSKSVEKQKRICQKFQYKLCSAPCANKISKEHYNKRIEQINKLFAGDRESLLKELYVNMKTSSVALDFERAAEIRNQIYALEQSIRNVRITTLEKDFKMDESLIELKNSLNLDIFPNKIAGFDISNIGGTLATGSLVTFENGLPKKEEYRKYKIRQTGPDDIAMIKELLIRRFKRLIEENLDKPDLILIDGGKSQVNAASEILNNFNLKIPVIGLTKKNEYIFLPNQSDPIILPRNSKALFLLQRIRDEAHRFAISYHKKLRSKKIQESLLNEIPGIGRKTRELLLNQFGSLENIQKASIEELQKIPKLKKGLAESIYFYFKKISH